MLQQITLRVEDEVSSHTTEEVISSESVIIGKVIAEAYSPRIFIRDWLDGAVNPLLPLPNPR